MIEPYGKYYRTTRDLTYRGVTVPKGTVTDGVSYKFRLVGVLINKFDPLYIEAVIFHDYLADLGDWDTANRVFEELLPDTRVAKVMVVAVKLYGKFVRGGR